MLLRSKHTEFIAEPLYICRRGQESTMHNNNAAKNLDMLTIMDMLEKEMLQAGYKDDFEFFLVNHVLLDSISRLYQSRTRRSAKGSSESCANTCRQRYPSFPDAAATKESRKRRLIMWMNYHGLEDAGQFILKINQTLHGR